jgi:hypothetical protein
VTEKNQFQGDSEMDIELLLEMFLRSLLEEQKA